MKLKKFLMLIFCATFLTSCMEPTALIGPGITVGKTGNIYQAGLSYGTNQVIKETTGKDTSEHLKNMFSDYTCSTTFSCFAEENIKKTRQLIQKHTGNFN